MAEAIICYNGFDHNARYHFVYFD